MIHNAVLLFICFSQVNGAQAESKMKNLPVPVFLRPLDENDPSMKVFSPSSNQIFVFAKSGLKTVKNTDFTNKHAF